MPNLTGYRAYIGGGVLIAIGVMLLTGVISWDVAAPAAIAAAGSAIVFVQAAIASSDSQYKDLANRLLDRLAKELETRAKPEPKAVDVGDELPEKWQAIPLSANGPAKSTSEIGELVADRVVDRLRTELGSCRSTARTLDSVVAELSSAQSSAFSKATMEKDGRQVDEFEPEIRQQLDQIFDGLPLPPCQVDEMEPHIQAQLDKILGGVDPSKLHEALTSTKPGSVRPTTIVPPSAILLLCLIPATTLAAPPRAIVTGPTTATPGEFLVLDASQSEREPTHYKWMIAPELKGRKQLVPSEDGKRCTVATYPGIYLVTLAVSNADGADLATWQVSIPGQVPCPPPEPKPVIPPTPIVPDTKPDQPRPPQPPPPGPVAPVAPDTMGVRSQIIVATKTVADPAGAVKLASAAESLAAKIRAGGEPSVQSVVNTIATEVQKAGPKWSALLSILKTAIQALLASGKLSPTDVATWATLLEEIAAALREGAK